MHFAPKDLQQFYTLKSLIKLHQQKLLQNLPYIISKPGDTVADSTNNQINILQSIYHGISRN